MKRSVISADDKIIGTNNTTALFHSKWKKMLNFKLEVSENKDVLIFSSKFFKLLNLNRGLLG